ncbi:hypothetical protein BD414DRAFT_473129 [Trametes punicea]|nr:hypothetical protein BD414DRAFT_473129 [Trametes punicea]
MLRASFLGLTSTHGISSRSYVLPCLRSLHWQACHESRRAYSKVSRLHPKETTAMSEGLPIVEELHAESSPSSIMDHPTSDVESTTLLSTTPTKKGSPETSSTPSAKDHIPTHLSQAARRLRRPTPPRYIFSRYAYRDHRIRKPLYEKLVDAVDVDEAWQTYQELLKYQPIHMEQSIPQKYLHCFAALLVNRSKSLPPRKTRTQTVFLRLLSVLNTIYYTGGQLRRWEWNALIECAGRGWRKTRLDDFQVALGVYRDMVANRAPGSSFASHAFLPMQDKSRIASKPVAPDVVTYTTLVTIAARTLNPEVLHLAEDMLGSSGIPPNRITYLVYLRYYTRKGRLGGVRSILRRLKENGWELGVDGLNALIWAFGRNGELRISALIYRILRHNLLPGLIPDDDVQDAIRQLDELENISVPAELKPDAITYYTLIQVYAYHGRLLECLRVFADMITSPERITGKLEDSDDFLPGNPTVPIPVLPIFRSVFLGFARHGVYPDDLASDTESTQTLDASSDSAWRAWTLKQLHVLFVDFIDLPQDAKPNSRTVYWLLVAFAITSGYDRAVLRSVLERLNGRYGGEHWDGRVRELRDKIYAEELDMAYFERLRASWERRRRES